jgi:hypothetical protein
MIFLDKITTISENTIVSENTNVYDHGELTEKKCRTPLYW